MKKNDLEKISVNNTIVVFDDYHLNWKNPYVIRPCLKKNLEKKKIFQGPKFVPISKEYFKSREKFKKSIRNHNSIKILLNMGANDSKNNNSKILNSLIKFSEKIKKITLVLSAKAPYYKEILSFKKYFKDLKIKFFENEKKFIDEYCKHNYFIGAAGLSSLERISLSAYSLTFSVSSNQLINGKEIELNNYGRFGGDINSISNEDLEKLLIKYLLNNNNGKNILKKTVIDGSGGKRISKILNKIIK